MKPILSLFLAGVLTTSVVTAAPGDRTPVFDARYGINLHTIQKQDLQHYSNANLMKVAACIQGAKLKRHGIYSRGEGFSKRIDNHLFPELQRVVDTRSNLNWDDRGNGRFVIRDLTQVDKNMQSAEVRRVLRNKNGGPGLSEAEANGLPDDVATYIASQYQGMQDEPSAVGRLVSSVAGLSVDGGSSDDESDEEMNQTPQARAYAARLKRMYAAEDNKVQSSSSATNAYDDRGYDNPFTPRRKPKASSAAATNTNADEYSNPFTPSRKPKSSTAAVQSDEDFSAEYAAQIAREHAARMARQGMQAQARNNGDSSDDDDYYEY